MMYSDVYRSMLELRGRGVALTARIRGGVRAQARRTMMVQWGHYLANEAGEAGRRTVEAMAPVLLDRAGQETRSILPYAHRT